MKLYETITTILLAGVLSLSLSACGEKGPMEEAGEEVDEVIEDAAEAVDDSKDTE